MKSIFKSGGRGKRLTSNMEEKNEELQEVCFMKDSPYRIHKVAAANDVEKFASLASEDNGRLTLFDTKGWTVLHHAANKGSVDILKYLAQHGADLNLYTEEGETALHLAVQAGNCSSIDTLLVNEANCSLQNKHNQTPLHLAVALGQNDCLQALLSHSNVDVHTPGDRNMTALHLAAANDDLISAKILLENGAFMCCRSTQGLNPIHTAAKNASKQVLELFLTCAEAKGYTRDYLLSSLDRDKHSPLHSAIDSGCTEPVRVCLEAGAHIDSKQADGSTPVHLVCSQGAIEIVKLMFEVQPQKKLDCLKAKDSNGMSPLHRAALFDYSDLVAYLVQQGAPLDQKDCTGRTPLLLAASRHCCRTAQVLLEMGADFTSQDKEKFNFLHLMIRNGADIREINIPIKCLHQLMNSPDVYGCTPLHYASKEGFLSSIIGLLDNGAAITCKNLYDESPLHFAAQFGRINTCSKLLDSAQGYKVINEVNHKGKTALHLAAENGHVKVVALLMQRGALLHSDFKGSSPLHLASQQGFTQTMKLLLNVHPSLLNATNNEGNTPLHDAAVANKVKSVQLLLTMGADIIDNAEERSFFDLAIERGNQEVSLTVVAHERWQEIFRMKSTVNGSYLHVLVKYLPDVCMIALDRCVTRSEHDPCSKEYQLDYNFEFIDNSPRCSELTTCKFRQKSSSSNHLDEPDDTDEPLKALTTMVKYHRVECLAHPVCLQYLQMKWNTFGFWVHMLNCIVYMVFLGCFTSVLLSGNANKHYGHFVTAARENVNISNGTTASAMLYRGQYSNMHAGGYLRAIIVLVFLAFNMIKELFQLFQLRWRYFLDFVNYVEWVLYVTAALFIVPVLLKVDYYWSWNCGATALFLSWLNLLLYLQRFEFFGIYIVMFLEILKTLIQVLIVFSILLFAFSFTFYAVMRNESVTSFKTIGVSIFSSFVMMVGEMNYYDTFVEPLNDGDSHTMYYSYAAFLTMALFLLFMPILLMNLLIGLAVGDIESVQKNARLKRLAMQVGLISDLEKKLPNFIIGRFNSIHITKHPNRCDRKIFTLFQNGINFTNSQNDVVDVRNDAISSSLLQHKAKLKELQVAMSAQTELLRLIVQKMEIHSEASEMDEGERDENADISLILKKASETGWKGSAIKHTVQKAKVLSKWGRQVSEHNLALEAANEGNEQTSL